jgi:predicted Zn-dependent peptidase
MLDRFQRHKDVLDNGLRLITVELPHLHSASIVMYVRAGSRYESREDNGLSHFLEHMLFRGTELHPDAYRINHAIEGLGGTLYAETARDYSLYQLSLPPETLPAGIGLFGEIFRTPTFEGLEVERRIILEEVLEDLDEDGREINLDDVARETMFPDHPLGFKITGPYENVERFSIADVRRHFARGYGARNAVLAIAGAVDHGQVLAQAAGALGRMHAGEPLAFQPPGDGQGAARFRYVENLGSQTGLQILFRAVPEAAAEFPALQLLGRVLDDGMSTRLHRRVCDELGLAYYVSGSIEAFADTALYEVDGSCAHGNVPALLRESLAVLSRLRDEEPSAEELDKARRRYRWDLQASFDDPDAMAGWWGGTELFFPPATLEEKLKRVESVSPADVSAMARRIFRPERMVVAAVGLLEGGLEEAVRREVEGWR